MSKIVDNLLDKLDQLKRKVMTDTEVKDDHPEGSSNHSEVIEEKVDSGRDSGVTDVKVERKAPGRPRRKKPKPKAQTKETPNSKEAVKKKPLKESSSKIL